MDKELELLKGNLHATIDLQFERYLAAVEPKPAPLPEDPKDPMAGYAQLPVLKDWKTVMTRLFSAQVAAKIPYLYGGKDPTPHNPDSLDYTGIDCSGEVREILIAITGDSIPIPDGSQQQGDWAKAYKNSGGQKLKVSTKQNLSEMDGRLRMGIYRVKPGVKVGHVFLVVNGVTYESYGSHGVGSRAWNDPTIQAIADEVYVLADKTA